MILGQAFTNTGSLTNEKGKDIYSSIFYLLFLILYPSLNQDNFEGCFQIFSWEWVTFPLPKSLPDDMLLLAYFPSLSHSLAP